MNPAATEQRLEALEIKLSFAEHTIDQLDRVLIAQQARIDRLSLEVQALRSAVLAQRGDPAARHARDDIPPHY